MAICMRLISGAVSLATLGALINRNYSGGLASQTWKIRRINQVYKSIIYTCETPQHYLYLFAAEPHSGCAKYWRQILGLSACAESLCSPRQRFVNPQPDWCLHFCRASWKRDIAKWTGGQSPVTSKALVWPVWGAPREKGNVLARVGGSHIRLTSFWWKDGFPFARPLSLIHICRCRRAI